MSASEECVHAHEADVSGFGRCMGGSEACLCVFEACVSESNAYEGVSFRSV